MSQVMDDVEPRFSCEILNKPPTHGVFIAVGSLFLLLTAFHGDIWFDESYSVAIASQSFSAIWTYGSCDVHPILYYCALHILYLIAGVGFGANATTLIAVYRVFTVLGAITLALLGYTHIRKDFGTKTGVFFSLLVVGMPFIAFMAVEIRMYTWAMFFVAVCFVYALRIMRTAPQKAPIPLHWWILFALSSLASAYLHYFAAIAAFLINLLLLIRLINCIGKKDKNTCKASCLDGKVTEEKISKKDLLTFIVCACLQIAAYAPWLWVLANQISVVSGTYWATFSFPHTVFELLGYPYLTSTIMFALFGSYGVVIQVGTALLLVLFLLVLLVTVGRIMHTAAFNDMVKHTAISGIIVYVGVLAIGCVASLLMGQLIVYYRYLSVALGPLVLSLSLVLAYTKPGILVKAFFALTILIALINQALLIYDDYSLENQKPLTKFVDAVSSCVEENNADESGANGSTSENDGNCTGKSDNDKSDALVLSSDIGFMGVTSVLYPEIDQTYLDWQPGNWGTAYRVYEPALRSVKSWDEALKDYEGEFVVIGQTRNGSIPKDVLDIAAKDGVEKLSVETYYRPYERTFFTIAIMEHSL